MMSSASSLNQLKLGQSEGIELAQFGTVPAWFDRQRFRRGQQFFEANVWSVLFSYFCALMVGFVVDRFSEVLIYTGSSAGPHNSHRRYLATVVHLYWWHTDKQFLLSDKSTLITDNNDIASAALITDSKAWNSMTIVGRMHRRVSERLEQKKGDRISQYDLAVVQSGFVGPLLLYPRAFGVSDQRGLVEFVYMWRVLGYLLGIKDQFNICNNVDDDVIKVHDLCAQVQNEIVIPGLLCPSKHFQQLGDDFVLGLRKLGLPISKSLVYAFTFRLFGIECPKLNWIEQLAFWWLRLQFLAMYYCAVVRRYFNRCAVLFMSTQLSTSQTFTAF